ncbi:protein FAR1-RELATED SEQUENCE 9-like [Nicotiana tabacum]|uniref:Protein FAR1-RELATED SEQUENCE 9-like n=1 Tax=Nicotiana tabacum TaxID=4097 RepID=A0AC58RPP2_TOBAC
MTHMLPSHRNLNDVQTHEIDLAEDAGLFSKGTFDFMSLQAGGRANLGCTKLDHKNYLRTKRQQAMGQGEAGVLLEYFEKKRVEDPSLFFAFFKHYDRAIEDKRYNELQDTCDASQWLPVLKAKVPILFHARYTPNIFSKFQDEYMKSLIIKVNGCEGNNFPIMYKVSKYEHTREHIVKVTEADHISCTCMKFESMGILCCHTIRILDVIRGVDKIPDEYILKRWTKTAKVVNIKEIDGQDIEIKDSKLIIVNRYRILCPIFVRMAAKASETDEGYKLAATCVNELSAKLKQIMEEPSYFDALAHTQNSCSLPHDQASFFESQGAQEFRDNYLL